MAPLFRVAAVPLAAVLVLGLASSGSAGSGSGTRSLLRSPGDEGDASGTIVVKVRAGHRGETMRLRVRGLDGASEYQVRDRIGGESLRSLRTSRSGTGRLKLANVSPETFGGMLLEVVDPVDGATVLEGEDPIPDMHSDGTCPLPEGTHQDHHGTDPGDMGSCHQDDAMGHDGQSGTDHHGDMGAGAGGDMHGGDSMHSGGGHM